MKSSKRQSLIMSGICMMLLAAVMLYFAVSQPRVTERTVLKTTASVLASAQSGVVSSFSRSESAAVAQQTSTQAAFSAAAEATAFTGQINLNTCTAEELMALDGIGEAKADAILQYREYLGGYTSVEQIKDIQGIGDKIYEQIAPYLTV